MAGTIANIKIEPSQVIFDGTDLGFTDGDIEITLEEQVADVTAHQTGTQVVDSIRTGLNVSLAIPIKETSTAQLQTLLANAGGTATALAEITSVTAVADVAGSLNDTYFLLSAANDDTLYYVWFDVATGGTDPEIAGRTGIEVDISTNDTAAAVATAMASAIDAVGDFGASAASGVVTITNAATGGATDAADSSGGTATGFTIAVTQQGIGAVTGWGESKRFSNVSNQTKILRLHPVGVADATITDDIVFWKAYPLVESLTKSGENPQLVNVTFRVYPDPSRPSAVNVFAQGALAG